MPAATSEPVFVRPAGQLVVVGSAIEEPMRDELRAQAARYERSVSAEIRIAIRKHLASVGSLATLPESNA